MALLGKRRHCLLCSFGLSVLLACTGDSKGDKGLPDGTPISREEEGGKHVDETARAGSCTSTEDCKTCPTESCGCVVLSAGRECPPTTHGCMVDPCGWTDPYCAGSSCAFLPAHGPCQNDDDCEARRHPWRCEYIPARADAPPTPTKMAVGCAGLPERPEVRCEEPGQRCVFAGTPTPVQQPSAPFELRWSCEMRGTAITKRTYEVREKPHTITVTDGGEPRKAELEPIDVGTLKRIVNSRGFSEFLAQSPESGPDHPGMESCQLEVGAGETKKTKSWKVGDPFTGAAEAARKELSVELLRMAKEADP